MNAKTKKTRWLVPALALGLGLGAAILLVPGSGLAQRGEEERTAAGQSLYPANLASMTCAAPPVGVAPMSIAGSSVETHQCYQEGKKQTLCFTVYNGSTDGEWIDVVRLTFPDAPGPTPEWTVNASSYEDPVDSVGYAVNFAHTIAGKQIEYRTADSDGYGEISNGASWMACVDVTVPSGYDGPRMIPWELEGDTTTGVGASGSIEIEWCTPLTLEPSQVVITGCNGTAQMLDFELTNYAAGNNITVNFIYDAPDAEFIGPTDLQMSEGETLTFTTHFEPKLCLEVGETVTGTLIVEGGGHGDFSFINQTIAETGGWRRRDDSPIPTMDNAVIWANHGDGGLWSIGGYGSGGAAQRYDPGSGEWLTYTNPLTPVIEYPMDGCYGRNAIGDEIIILFPDTIVTGTLQIFNISAKEWYTETTPTSPDVYPPEGRWGHDVVSMLQHTGENVCYLSGGSTQTGGGRTRDLWEYHPETNTVIDHSPFPASVWFGFHASWFVPWVGGADGAICVAGGVDHNHIIHRSTQCFYRSSGTFGDLDSDLGQLPELWWGMADGWAVHDGHYQLWIANGVAQDGTLLPASAYIQGGMSDFAYGPEIPHGLYRLEGDSWDGQFYTLNGSRGGFWYSEFSLHLALCPTCYQVFLPLVLRNF